MSSCDDLNLNDLAGGRVGNRDLHAAAFRRGRHWPSLCVPEAVVLSLPLDRRRGTEPTDGLPQRRSTGSSVNDLGPSPRSRTGPAARWIIVLSAAEEHSRMNLTLQYRRRSAITEVPEGLDVTPGAEPEAGPRRASKGRSGTPCVFGKRWGRCMTWW